MSAHAARETARLAVTMTVRAAATHRRATAMSAHAAREIARLAVTMTARAAATHQRATAMSAHAARETVLRDAKVIARPVVMITVLHADPRTANRAHRVAGAKVDRVQVVVLHPNARSAFS
jgi:hypothetical protein